MNRVQVLNKKECCGCAACAAACPKNAIQMRQDEYGFLYPIVTESLCVDCGICKKVCMYQEVGELKEPYKAYAAASAEDGVLRGSASGGVFFEIAKRIIENHGIVYGCAFEEKDGKLQASHIRADNEEELKRLQGSKYVQSTVEASFKDVKKDLQDAKTVLFSGTPCQIGALYHYLGKKEYENLYTVDIICHGVPNMTFLQDYIQKMEKSLRGKIIDINFRDKSYGWGLNGSIIYLDRRGQKRKKKMPLQGFSYYKMFLDADIYRESCYNCMYAKGERVGDITVGDYWGIEKIHPEFAGSVEKGVSCILVNTLKGENLLKESSQNMKLLESSVEKVARNNKQLNAPSEMTGRRKQIMKDYADQGYIGVEKKYYKRFGVKGILYRIWNYLPGRKIDEEVSVVRENEKCD